MEDWKKKYEEARERMKYWMSDDTPDEFFDTHQVDTFVFPELAESEDEKIRKAIKEYFINSFQNNGVAAILGVHIKDVLAWLEKQGEQKIAEYEKPLLEKFKQAVYDCAWGKVTCKTEGETQEEYAERWAEQLLSIVRDWADDYIDNRETAITRRAYEKGKADSLKEQKPAWSEEDERKLKTVISLMKSNRAVDPFYDKMCLEYWLKSLKNRVQPQPKQEWSEEDEKMVGNIRRIIEKYAFSQSAVDVNGDLCEKEFIDADNWLKYLKDRYTWKPSELDVKILEQVIDGTVNPINYHATLHAILGQLKKLRE